MRASAALAGLLAVSAAVPTVVLRNAALPGTAMPAVGLGTGGYSQNGTAGMGAYPECWDESTGCASYVLNATVAWLQLAEASGEQLIRIDQGNTYADVETIGEAMRASGVARSRIFLLQKVGSGLPMGYNDTLTQFADILATMKVKYVDSLLIHWPTSSGNSSDPACGMHTPTYNATECRLQTWRACVDIFSSGGALSIGVSNFNSSQIEELVTAGLPLPAINQIPIHIYRSSSQAETIEYCQRNGITVNSYSPLGVPDWHVFPADGGMSPTPLADPVVMGIAAVHGRTPAAVILAWLWAQGIVTNPRSVRPAHMADNMGAYDLTLTDAEVALLSSRPQDWCSLDPGMYECAPDNIGPAVAGPPVGRPTRVMGGDGGAGARLVLTRG